MTKDDVVRHWRTGVKDALEMAQLALQAGKYEHALFNCHLAVEKALKAAYLEQHDADHPFTHDLVYIAGLIHHNLNDQELNVLGELTGFVVDARYADLAWAEEQATRENAVRWIDLTQKLLSRLEV